MKSTYKGIYLEGPFINKETLYTICNVTWVEYLYLTCKESESGKCAPETAI